MTCTSKSIRLDNTKKLRNGVAVTPAHVQFGPGALAGGIIAPPPPVSGRPHLTRGPARVTPGLPEHQGPVLSVSRWTVAGPPWQ
jgi:hypothetical protein